MIKRREFLKNTVLASAGLSLMPDLAAAARPARAGSSKLLNAYYFRAHMYTIVPHQVREDLKWMADIGTNAVSLAIIEQDLFAAVENVDIICNEAEKLNMKVFAVPSRWGGMLAGAPKVPSLFSVKNPQTWVLNKDGKTAFNDVSGVMSSVHYPETRAFFESSLDKIFKLWPVKGIVWDEPKSMSPDYSPAALAKLGKNAGYDQHVQAVVDFFSDLNWHIKEKHPDVATCMFTYADMPDSIIQAVSKSGHLDYCGCDGRPWRNEDGGKQESPGKVLLGKGERFLSAAHQNGKKSLWLIENHNLQAADIPLMEKRFPEIMTKDVDHLIYYYYPRNTENPDKSMKTIANYVKNFK